MSGVNELMNRYNIETAQGMARIIRTLGTTERRRGAARAEDWQGMGSR